jgi:hypothetical protein
MNATLYATFAIFGVLSGSFFNILGTKIIGTIAVAAEQ